MLTFPCMAVAHAEADGFLQGNQGLAANLPDLTTPRQCHEDKSDVTAAPGVGLLRLLLLPVVVVWMLGLLLVVAATVIASCCCVCWGGFHPVGLIVLRLVGIPWDMRRGADTGGNTPIAFLDTGAKWSDMHQFQEAAPRLSSWPLWRQGQLVKHKKCQEKGARVPLTSPLIQHHASPVLPGPQNQQGNLSRHNHMPSQHH